MDQQGIQLMPKSIIQARNGKESKQQRGTGCLSKLRELCVAEPPTWKHMQMYLLHTTSFCLYLFPCLSVSLLYTNVARSRFAIGQGGSGCSARNFTDYTAEFLLTRGEYAMLGYSWCGCTNGEQMRPRAKEWDMEFGEPIGARGTSTACVETGTNTGVFRREYTKATVEWDCGTGHGTITPKK